MAEESALSAAVREWEEAAAAYRELIHRFVPVSNVEPGKPLKAGEPFTPEAIEEIKAAETRQRDAENRMNKLMFPGRDVK